MRAATQTDIQDWKLSDQLGNRRRNLATLR